MNKILILLLISLPAFSQISPSDSANMLNLHNKARKEVGVGPLVWSKTLSAYAEYWAEHLSTKRSIFHSKCIDFNGRAVGENIYWSSSHDIHNATDAFKAWYDERHDYTYGMIKARSGRKMVGHYTQIVWRDTKEMGMGMATTSSGGLVVVTSYFPAGNVIEEYPY